MFMVCLTNLTQNKLIRVDVSAPERDDSCYICIKFRFLLVFLCRWTCSRKSRTRKLFPQVLGTEYNINVMLAGNSDTSRVYSCHLLGKRLTGGSSSYIICCCLQMWWGMNCCDSNSTRSLSSNDATRRGAIGINSQQEVVNHPRAWGQEFALNKWKIKRRASCCCLQLVLGRQVLNAAGGIGISINEPLSIFSWNTVFGA
jgi:hypothetical protein